MMLIELNALLNSHKNKLDLPEFRSEVGASGSNLQWLNKNLKKNPNVPARIRELLSKPISELTKPS
ncbi:hypothetical protein fHeYen902_052c [Yersinia phage fHe-Yen9-02]|nr:hypothetical protein fHeYen902_052c [Yersinia phage fHe-Yen9-02]